MQTFTCKKCHTPLDLSIHFNYEYVKNVNDNSIPTTTYELNAKCSSCNKIYKIIAAFPKEVVIQ